MQNKVKERQLLQRRQNKVKEWQLLQRLSQAEAAVILNEDFYYYFFFRGRVMDPVGIRTLLALISGSYVQRELSTIPTYTISNWGREALQRRQVGLSKPVQEASEVSG
jgi:hypothetical protein